MTKSNIHKKTTRMDWFGRTFYCKNARVTLARSEKKVAKKLRRRQLKDEIRIEMGD